MVEAVNVPPDPVEDTSVSPVGIPQYPSEQPSVSPDIAQRRTNKADIGGIGGIVGKTSDEMRADIEAGHEKDLRDLAASSLDVDRMKAKKDKITELSQRYGPLSSAQISQLLDPFNPINQPTDPDTVIERMY